MMLTTHYSLLTTHYSLLTTHYSLLTTHYSLLTTHYSLLTTHYSLLTTHYSLFAIRPLHAPHRHDLEHQFGAPAHRSCGQIRQDHAAGHSLPARDQVPGRQIPGQTLPPARLRAYRAQRP